jgi:hypothetical protein
MGENVESVVRDVMTRYAEDMGRIAEIDQRRSDLIFWMVADLVPEEKLAEYREKCPGAFADKPIISADTIKAVQEIAAGQVIENVESEQRRATTLRPKAAERINAILGRRK